MVERIWIVRAERMKAKRDHSVPLGLRAFEVLAEMEELGLNRRDTGCFRLSRGSAAVKLSHVLASSVWERPEKPFRTGSDRRFGIGAPNVQPINAKWRRPRFLTFHGGPIKNGFYSI